MEFKDLKQLLNLITLSKTHEDTSYVYAFATDLMSDALAMIKEGECTLLLTGLCREQVIRTAEILDIHTIIFVRDKIPDQKVIELAKDLDINLYQTQKSMFEASGILYKGGIKP